MSNHAEYENKHDQSSSCGDGVFRRRQSIRRAARREVREETGLADIELAGEFGRRRQEA